MRAAPRIAPMRAHARPRISGGSGSGDVQRYRARRRSSALKQALFDAQLAALAVEFGDESGEGRRESGGAKRSPPRLASSASGGSPLADRKFAPRKRSLLKQASFHRQMAELVSAPPPPPRAVR